MIGIFDSGSGGLTVLRAIRDRLPSADITYFGDIKNAPYGSKSHEELSLLTVKSIQFLQSHGATSIVSACNSVSASLAVSLYDTFSLTSETLVEMVGPTVRYFRKTSGRLLLCATPATIASGIYQNAFLMIGISVTCVAIPELAFAIESGLPDFEIETMIKSALQTILISEYDALILACTHYPLVKKIFVTLLGNTLYIMDPADAVSERVENKFWPKESGNGTIHFYISKESTYFRTLVSTLFPNDLYTVEIVT